jgi:septal ring factor EnvC (AmiA/AmiB activator)
MSEEKEAAHLEFALAEIKQQLDARDDRIAELEKRLEDQEYSVRSVLDMLVDWLETDTKPKTAIDSEAA